MRGTMVLSTTVMQGWPGKKMATQYIASDELKSLLIHMCIQWYYLLTHPVTNNVLCIVDAPLNNLVSLCRKCP